DPAGATSDRSAPTASSSSRWFLRRKGGHMGRVNVDGVGTAYEVTGHGAAVVLLHGFPDSGRLWRHQVPALAEAGFQVIVPDLRGYGRSDKPAAVEAYSLMHIAGDVLAILADLQVP